MGLHSLICVYYTRVAETPVLAGINVKRDPQLSLPSCRSLCQRRALSSLPARITFAWLEMMPVHSLIAVVEFAFIFFFLSLFFFFFFGRL